MMLSFVMLNLCAVFMRLNVTLAQALQTPECGRISGPSKTWIYTPPRKPPDPPKIWHNGKDFKEFDSLLTLKRPFVANEGIALMNKPDLLDKKWDAIKGYLMSDSEEEFEVILDTGCTHNVTYDENDFVGEIREPSNMHMQGIANKTTVRGIGLIEWNFLCDEGNVHTV